MIDNRVLDPKKIVKPHPPNESVLRTVAERCVGWEAVRRAYNEATGENRSRPALQRFAYRIGFQIPCKSGKGGRSLAPRVPSYSRRVEPGPPIRDHREIQLRTQALRLYKDVYRIVGRAVTPEEFAEAMARDVDSWPDGFDDKSPPSGMNCAKNDREWVRIHRSHSPEKKGGKNEFAECFG